jgi:hypothetical protein
LLFRPFGAICFMRKIVPGIGHPEKLISMLVILHGPCESPAFQCVMPMFGALFQNSPSG